jgi:outer membrane lipoprotein-sorting protein
MRHLRSVSTDRLLAIIAGLVLVAGGGTAIAVAAAGSGPVPPREPLAQAIHQALAAPAVTGVSARISFTNHLIDSGDIQGSDPLLQGASGRLWLSTTPGDHRFRLELQSDNGDAQLVFDNGSFWAYDPSSHTAYEGSLAHTAKRPAKVGARRHGSIPTIAAIQRALERLGKHAQLSGAIPSDVAGQATYTLRISPKRAGGLLGAAELAWDAARGVPLRIAIYARGDSTPVLQLSATDISFGPVPASVFAISPPANADVVHVDTSTLTNGHAAHARGAHVRGALTRAGTHRHVIVYGHGLGAVVVLQQPASRHTAGAGAGGNGQVNLPSVNINGATATILSTPLGTLLRFTRGKVTYTVVGSVRSAVAIAAARRL